MRIAIVGSRDFGEPDIEGNVPGGVTEIVSGGARGVDACAREYALAHGIRYVELLPDYKRYGRRAPLIRNLEIAKYADAALIFWDGASRGTKHAMECFLSLEKPFTLIKKEN